MVQHNYTVLFYFSSKTAAFRLRIVSSPQTDTEFCYLLCDVEGHNLCFPCVGVVFQHPEGTIQSIFTKQPRQHYDKLKHVDRRLLTSPVGKLLPYSQGPDKWQVQQAACCGTNIAVMILLENIWQCVVLLWTDISVFHCSFVSIFNCFLRHSRIYIGKVHPTLMPAAAFTTSFRTGKA